MGGRALVRQRSLVIAAALLAAVMPRLARGQAAPPLASPAGPEPPKAAGTDSQPAAGAPAPEAGAVIKPAAVDLGSRPYSILAWVVVDPRARIDAQGRAILIETWRSLARRFVGPPWQLEVADGPGPLLGGDLDHASADAIAAAAPGRDKAWLIVIGPDGGDGFALAGREFDATTLRLGQVTRHHVTFPADAPRGLLDLALALFSPVAAIGEQAGGGVKITVQGAGLPAADPVGRVIAKGSTFRLIRLNYDLKGVIARYKNTNAPIIKDVPHSFLRVDTIEGPVATCSIISGVRDPLTKRALRSKVVALGIKPAAIPSRFRFVIPPERPKAPTERRELPPPKPAGGFILTFRDFPNGSPRPVGITDRDGRIVLPANFSDKIVVLRLQAGSNEPLVEFPAMPGEYPEEQRIPVQPKPEAVVLETAVNALRDELVDLVGIRARLEARMKTRRDAERWDEARELAAQYRKLPNRKSFEDRLNQLKQKATEDQRALKRPILTLTAQALMADATALVDRFLKDDVIEDVEDDLKSHGGVKVAAAPPAPAPAAGAAPIPAPAPAAGAPVPAPTPAAAAIPAGWVDFTPPDGSFRIAFPVTPTTQSRTESVNGQSLSITMYVCEKDGQAFFATANSLPGELPPAGRDAFFQASEDGMAARMPGARFVSRRPITLGALPGREAEYTIPKGALLPSDGTLRVRIYLDNRRSLIVMYLGEAAKAHTPPVDAFLDSIRPGPR